MKAIKNNFLKKNI